MAPGSIIHQSDEDNTLSNHASEADTRMRAFINDALAGTLSTIPNFALFGDYRGIAETVAFAYEQGGSAAAVEALEAMCKQNPELQSLLTAASEAEQPQKTAPEHASGYEPLPDGMLPDVPCDGVGAWLELYTSYASAKSPMSPFLFHQSAGLALWSIAVARRLVLPMGFANVYPNLYFLWVAITSLFRKTTALEIAADLARRVFPHLLTPQEYTPEALLADMAGEKPTNLNGADADAALLKRWQEQRDFAAQRGGFYDEMSGMLARAGKDYNAGLLEFIMKAYDCADEYSSSTRSHGFLAARHIYFSLLGASTPAALAKHLCSERLWGMGWWPRFVLLAPPIRKPKHANPPRDIKEPAELSAQLSRFYERLPMPTWPKPPETLTVTLGLGVEDCWGRYDKFVGYELINPDGDDRLAGAYARMPIQALKVAMLLAAMDWPQDLAAPRIELPHLVRAIHIAEEWRASVHRTLAMADQTDYEKLENEICSDLARTNGTGMTLRDLRRALGNRRQAIEIENVLTQLEMTGEVRREVVQNPKGGPKTTRYYLVTE